MTMRAALFLFAATACILPAQELDQNKSVAGKPSAKELFLNPRQMAYGVQDQTPVPAKTQSKSATKATQPKPRVKATNAAVTGQSSSAPARTANAVPIVPATYSNIPLGLRYTVRKKEGDQITGVRDSQFHFGEHIQLTLEVDDSGYLYSVQQGTSGKWEALSGRIQAVVLGARRPRISSTL